MLGVVDLKMKLKMGNRVVIILIGVYQATHGLFFWGTCRFQPTCSVYGKLAFENLSFLKALWLTLYRIFRCHPFSKGGYEPLPINPLNQKGKYEQK